MTYTDSSTWRRTLGEHEGDPHSDSRARLRSAYQQFRSRVEPLAGEIALSVPGYTDHSILHCDSLWDITDVVAGPEYPLTPAEAFVLGGAFLIHDLGMGLAAHEQGIAGILEDAEWIDLLAALYPDTFEELQDATLQDLQGNPTWDGLTSQNVKRALTIFLRDHHAEQAERIVTQQWSLSNHESFYLLEDSELRLWYGQLIGRLGRSHWQDVESLPDTFGQALGAAAKLPTDWTVDPLKLAGILRCVDAAQIDARRADPMHTPFRRPQGDSLNHWLFQERMLYPQLQNDRLSYTSSTRFSAEQASAWWLAYDTIQMVDGELDKVDALFADLGKPRLSARAVAGAQAPTRFAKYVPTDNWMPIDARPTISDTDSVIENLGGSALYGLRRGDVVIRELLANAVDATRLRRAAYKEGRIDPIRVHLRPDENVDVFEIRDHGIGMTAEEMVAYLCDFGRSGWRSQTTRKNHPGALASGYQSTGRFGIGFYSAFMVADDVTVTTRAAHLGPADTMILHFTNGLKARPLMRPADRKDWLMEPGTKVTLRLHDDWDSKDSVGMSRRYAQPEDLAEGIRHLALLCDEAIELVLPTNETVHCVGSRSWTELSNADLFDQLVGGASSSTEVVVERAREVFRNRVRPLFGPDGSVQGRMCLDLGGDMRVYGREVRRVPGNIYCGGFFADNVENVAGVLAGEPVTAAREMAWPIITHEEIRRWFDEQVTLLAETEMNESLRLTLSAWALSLGELLEDQPLVLGKDGALTPTQFRSWVRTADEFAILDYVTEPVNIGDERRVYLDYAEQALHELPEGFFGSPAFQDLGMALYVPHSTEGFIELPPRDLPTPHGDLSTWWFYNYRSVTGAVVRLAAQEWGKSIEATLATAEWTVINAEGIGGFDIETIDGRTVKQSGVRFRRP